MSKKDYIAIADALKSPVSIAHDGNKNEPLDIGYAAAVEHITSALAKVFAADNAAFNAGRWFDYLHGLCGPNGGAIKKG